MNGRKVGYWLIIHLTLMSDGIWAAPQSGRAWGKMTRRGVNIVIHSYGLGNTIRLVSLFFLLAFAKQTYPVDAIELDVQIKQILDSEKLVGISWATTSDGAATIGSAGHSNLGSGSVFNESSKVHVGSITKTVLAMGVMRLITQGQLSLDTEVAALLPEVTLTNPWRAISPVTVKHLLEHTAGLDNLRMWQFLNTRPGPDTALVEAFQSPDSSLLQIRTQPGSRYSYSNMGYTLLGMVIEATVKMRYETYLDDNLLKPLGMTNSTFHFVSQRRPDGDGTLAMGYLDDDVSQEALPMYLRPAGQFTTTAADMAIFSIFLLQNSFDEDGEFIRPDLMGALGFPTETDAARAGLSIGHGLALAARDRHGVLALCHPGTTFGYRAYLCLFPNQGKSFFYAVNTDNETANYERLNVAFIKALGIDKTSPGKAEGNQFNLATWQGVYVLAPNNMAQFEWLDRLFNSIYLSWNQDHFILRSLQCCVVWLYWDVLPIKFWA